MTFSKNFEKFGCFVDGNYFTYFLAYLGRYLLEEEDL